MFNHISICWLGRLKQQLECCFQHSQTRCRPSFMKASLVSLYFLSAVCAMAQATFVPSNASGQISSGNATGPDFEVLNGGASGSGHVVEISTGLNYWDGASWQRSIAAFEQNRQDGSFVASHVQNALTLSQNINLASAVSVYVGSQILSSSPIGIGLYDALSGQFLLIGSITNCAGTLLSSNQVYYEQAYSGVCASLLYTIEQGAVSQDVVFTGRLDPSDYGFPNDTTRIQIITEFYQPPVPDVLREPVSIQADPTKRLQMASPDLYDETLTFGPLVFGAGLAFTLPGSLDPSAEAGIVAKEFVQNSDGRYFLIESIPFSSIQRGLLGLPVCGTQSKSAKKMSLKNGYALLPAAPTRLASRRHRFAQAAASAEFGRKRPAGVYIDYRATLTGGATLAQSDTTYLVSSGLSCTTLTLEGGCVLKYKAGASITANTLICKTSQFRPAVLTAVDDDTVGESMNGYTNSGYTGTISSGGYANPALKLGTQTLAVSGCIFRYAQKAIQYAASSIPSTTITLTHSQLYKCITGIDLLWSGCGSGAGGSGTVTLGFNNALLANVQNPVNVNSLNTTVKPTLINCTIDQSAALIAGSGGTMVFNSTNSIFSSLTNSSSGTFSGQNNGFYSSAQTFGSSSYSTNVFPFQNVGAGNYYLTDASRFRNVGTTSGVPTSLISDLGKRTTYPPTLVAATILSTPQVLSPQADRDLDALDLGYHYDPLDYEFGWVLVTNAAITIKAGTIIGTFGTNSGAYGLGIGQAASLSSQGTATAQNWVVQYNTVQEEPYTNWFQTTNGSICSEFQGLSPGATNNFRFTSWSILSQAATHFNGPTNVGPFNFQDCEFHGGKITTLGPTLNLTNCLLERVYIDLEPKDNQTNYIRTCLAFGGNFILAATNAYVADNLFDKPAITNWNSYTGTLNAYITNNTRLQPTLANDILLSASPSYQAGPLGNYYQTNTSVLINADTYTTADQIGLYHYTVITNTSGGAEIKETNSFVDVSYHYVATDTNGVPLDSNGDGISDYIEDANGNGAVDSGELDWLHPNILIWITKPAGPQPLP